MLDAFNASDTINLCQDFASSCRHRAFARVFWRFDALFDAIEIISLVLRRERNAFDDDFDVNEIEKRISWCNSVKHSFFRRIFEKLTTFFISASNIIAISLNVDDESDRDDCVTSRDSKLINDDDNDDDDEARSKEKSTEIALWFFFFQSKTSSSKRKKQRRLFFDFFFLLLKSKFSKRRKQRKLSFDFSFSLNA
jgi:hypothetical protein